MLCFWDSGIEEMKLPSALKKIDKGAFGCAGIRTVYVEDGCKASLASAGLTDSASVVLLSTMLIGVMDI